MAFNQFHCPYSNKKSEAVSHFDNKHEIIYVLSYHHTYIEQPIDHKSHIAADIESLDKKKLMPFQIKGVEFVEKSNINCLIADEMGLGKTVQALAVLNLHRKELLPCAIICKSSLKDQWARESVRWLGQDVMPYVIEGSSDFIPKGLPIYIFSYDILRRYGTRLNEIFKSLNI